MRAIDRKVFRDLSHLKTQVIAIALVVASGAALFVSLRSMYVYLTQTQASYYEDYRFADVFAPLKRAPRSVAQRIETIPGVVAVEPRIVYDVLLDVPDLVEPATGRLISIPIPRAPMLNDLYLREGSFPSRDRNEIVVSEVFAEANAFGVGDEISAILNGRWQQLRIVGIALSPEYVYEIGSGQIFPDNRRFGVLWMSEQAVSSAFDMEGGINNIAIRLSRDAVVPDVISEVDRVLAPYGGVGAYDRQDQVSHRFVNDEIAEIRVTSVLIPAIFLLVTAFLLHMVLTRLVAMQRTEIGVLKAFGYGDLDVALHFLKLALVPVLSGCALGVAIGLWLAVLLADQYARYFRFPVIGYDPDLRILVPAILIVVVSALIGAMGGVWRSLRLPPAEAMRPESPGRYRAGVLEQLGLQRFASTTTRMILRSLERKPVRALFSVIGIAFAVSLVFSGLYIYDAIYLMKDVQFEDAQREDVMVVFHELQGPSVLHELDHLPGVVHSEGIRYVSARLRTGHRSKRIAILGLRPGTELRRIVDWDRQIHELSPAGVILTSKLGELLEIEAGDTVRLEVLEGTRPTIELEVVRLVDEMIGLSAYLPLEDLSRALRESEMFSGALLSVDPIVAEELYAELKRIPAISGVGVREAAVKGFEDTLQTSFRTSVGSVIFFACLISFGMVYNSSRIALSERGRELASLRVLGFSRGEVGMMLLGEQAILTVLALPVGFLIGYGLSALIALRADTELFRLPLTIEPSTYLYSASVVIAASAVSSVLVRRRLDRSDLVAVLKTRD